MPSLALYFADAVPGGARYQCFGSCANVRLLPAGRARAASAVEETGDGLSDYPVRFQLWDFGSDAVSSFYRVGMLRAAGLVLQCRV